MHRKKVMLHGDTRDAAPPGQRRKSGKRHVTHMTFRRLSRIAISACCIFSVMAFGHPGTLSAKAEDADLLDSLPGPAESAAGNYLAAVVAGAARDTRAAALYFREALRDDPNNPELLERAFVALLANGDMQEAFSAARQLLKRDSSNGLARLALGVEAIKARRYVTARRYLGSGGRGRAADLTATLLTAWSWVGSGDLRRALDTVERLKGETSYNVFRDYHAGLIAAVGGNRREAENRLKAAYDVERTTLRVVDAYGRLLSVRGETEEARRVYEAFDRLLPRNPIVQDALKRLDAGQTLPALIANTQEGAAEVLYGLGAAGNSQGDEIAALIYLRLATFLAPKHELAIVTLGDMLERLKQYSSAIEVFDTMPADSPLRSSIDIQIAISLELMGEKDKAQKHLEEMIEANPGDVEALIALGNLLRSRKEFAEAAKIYTRAVEAIGTPDQSRWTLFYFRGIAYERSKEWPKAEADFKKALELAPESVGSDRALVLNYLGYSWVDRHMNLEEAFEMLKRAVELRPRDGYIVDSLGWAYYRLGRYDDAVRELERAIELRPADPTINDHLGDAYWRTGRKLEAKFQWNHARDLGPEPEDLPKILEKIEKGLPDEDKPAAAEAVEKPQNGG